ncbi:MAG: (d)CMP kinase [Alphaproteobacteria bacterium]|nr:(d)CMP kinase [Alphaproteobacteria bacterium]
MVICIDGPAGAGKGTVAKALAARFGWHYLDTGKLYRRLARLVLDHLAQATDDSSEGTKNEGTPRPVVTLDSQAVDAIAPMLPALCKRIAQQLATHDPQATQATQATQGTHDQSSGESASASLSLDGEEIGAVASTLAADPRVRTALLAMQQDFVAQRRQHGVVLDGRDTGTVICPDATLKVFLTASAEARARRRYEQNLANNIDCDYTATLIAIQRRDILDANRSVAPLKPACDAQHLDSTSMSEAEVLAVIMTWIDRAMPTSPTQITF